MTAPNTRQVVVTAGVFVAAGLLAFGVNTFLIAMIQGGTIWVSIDYFGEMWPEYLLLYAAVPLILYALATALAAVEE